MKPKFFATPDDFRIWLEKHHADTPELWVGFHKKDTGRPSVTWPESVDEALCVGWIDGLRKSIDAHSYMIRFTPRKPVSIWSAVNVKRVRRYAIANYFAENAQGLDFIEAFTETKTTWHPIGV